MVLDPGGHKVHTSSLRAFPPSSPSTKCVISLFSHQDPDIIAGRERLAHADGGRSFTFPRSGSALSRTSVSTNLWVAAFTLFQTKAWLFLWAALLYFLPAHFLHSRAIFRFTIRFPRFSIREILAHRWESPIRRWWNSKLTCPPWKASTEGTSLPTRRWPGGPGRSKTLDIQQIAPQHGAIFPTPEMARGNLSPGRRPSPCALDSEDLVYQVPS